MGPGLQFVQPQLSLCLTHVKLMFKIFYSQSFAFLVALQFNKNVSFPLSFKVKQHLDHHQLILESPWMSDYSSAAPRVMQDTFSSYVWWKNILWQ